MKSLLDIQQDIRKLENSIQKITDNIKNINSDIESIRNVSERDVLDLSKIKICAKQLTFGKHPLDKLKEERACQIYLEMLLNIVRLDKEEEVTINRMVFIQWLQIQSHCEWSLGDLYSDCFKIEKKLYYEFADLFSKKYREYFIVDALIVANIGGSVNREIYEYIADIVAILGMADEVKELALISRLALSQSVEGISRESLEKLQDKHRIEEYNYYIWESVAKDAIKALRVIEVELHDNDAKEFKWKVKQHQKVQKGDLIAIYQKTQKGHIGISANTQKIEEIRATVSGTIFQFRNNNTNYGVISYTQDNKKSIKEWIRRKKIAFK